ncbi:MAG: tetratricopeptide repeat protein [Planctomycetota bacterium]
MPASQAVRDLVTDAERLLEDGEAEAALRTLERALAYQPDCFPALLARQETRLALSLEKEVLAEARQAVHERQDDPAACVLLARLLPLEEGEAAERLLLRALERAPEHPWALHGLGVLEARAGRFEKAEELFTRALEVHPAHRNARLHRAYVRDQLADFEGAASDYELYLRDQRGNLTALYNLASITHRELHRPDEAEELYRVLLDIDGGMTAAVVGLAVCLTEQQKYHAAESLYLSVCAKEPSALFNLGMLYQEQLDQPDLAGDCFRKFMALAGEQAERQSIADRLLYAPVRLSELELRMEEQRLHAEAIR